MGVKNTQSATLFELWGRIRISCNYDKNPEMWKMFTILRESVGWRERYRIFKLLAD